MLNLINGPVKGAYACKTAPPYLRAVIDEKGNKDCLDLPEDTPGQNEKVYVYKRYTLPMMIHFYGTKIKGFYPSAEYRYLPDIDG